MSIFKRSSTEAQQASAETSPETAQGSQAATATMVPPLVAPGVVPPPAAPIYSTLPQEKPAAEDPGPSMAEKLRMTKEALENARVSLEGNVRIAAQRSSRSSTSQSQGVQRRPAQQVVPSSPRTTTTRAFDPVACAQTGLLNLAWRWQEAGSPIRAIHTYMELLDRYPDTPAASAAVADLVKLSEKLANEGQFHAALAIFDRLEQLQ